MGMEGGIARWYDRTRARHARVRQLAHASPHWFPRRLSPGSGPGTGILSIELAQRGLQCAPWTSQNLREIAVTTLRRQE